MHQSSIAVQPDARVTPAPHRATTPIPSEKRPGCRRGFRSSKEGDSHAAIPSLWEARVPGPGRALPNAQASGQLFRPRRPLEPTTRRCAQPHEGGFSQLYTRPASACGSSNLRSTLGDDAALRQLVIRHSAASTLLEEPRAGGGAGAWGPGSCAQCPWGSRRQPRPAGAHSLRPLPPRGRECVTVGNVLSEVYFRRLE